MEIGEEQTTEISVERGLYVLRYESAKLTGDPPSIFIRPATGSEHAVRLIAVPGTDDNRLSIPSSNMVVLAYQDAALRITSRARTRNGSVQANLRLEPLGKGPGLDDVLNKASSSTTSAVSPSYSSFSPLPKPDITVLMHVSRRGDVVAGPDIWVGGPEAPAQIEGIEVRWTSPIPNLDIEYQALGHSPGGQWAEWTPSGRFVGTRGQARPLVGMRFRLTQARSSDFQVQAEALFNDGTAFRKSGQQVELISPSGIVALVGLRLSVVADQQVASQWRGATEQHKRVRVFRSAQLQREGR